MRTHKPGPWTLCFDGQIDAADGSTVCVFHWNSFKDFSESDEAGTARLIAAAPDLLEVVIGALGSFQCTQDVSKYPDDHWSQKAIIAIAKATGEAP